MRIIAFTGPKGCGKDTAAKCLLKLNQGIRFNYFRKAMMAEGVKNICTDFFGWSPEDMEDFSFKETPRPLWEGGPVMEPRWPMMDIANWLRAKYGGAIHARRWERHCHMHSASWGAHVVTDLRFPQDELPVLRQYDSLVIYIEREEAENKLAAQKEARDPKALNQSEAHYSVLREEADLIIPNNGAIHQLHNAVLMAVRQKFGHWAHWGIPKLNYTNQELAEEMHRG